MKVREKHTFLYEEHKKLGAKMVPFAGWEMPIQYSSILEEHKCVRENVGIFDVSHMGEVFVSGQDSLAFLQKLVPQDLSILNNGKASYCQMTNENGGIIDDLIIYRLEENNYLLVINASRVEEDMAWIEKNKKEFGFDVLVDNQSENYSLIAVQGPKSKFVLERSGLAGCDQPLYFSIKQAVINNIKVFVSRTGYTGEDGFEILVHNNEAKDLWNFLIEAGSDYNLQPIGLGARDTLRLEASLLLYGQDMTEDTTPVEASLGWSVSKSKIEDYNGKKVIMGQFDKRSNKRLIGFKMIDRAIPRHGYEIFQNDKKLGIVTSGGVAPSLQANIGLGYVESEEPLKSGTELSVKVRNRMCRAEIVKRPFVPKTNKLVK